MTKGKEKVTGEDKRMSIRKRTGSSVEEGALNKQWDPLQEQVEFDACYERYEEEEREKDGEREERVQRIEGRSWRPAETIADILNAENSVTDSDFEPTLVAAKINEGVLRNLKGTKDRDVWWSTESNEVKTFRTLMAESARMDEAEWLNENPRQDITEAMSTRIRPRFLAAPLGGEQLTNSLLRTVKTMVRYGDAKLMEELDTKLPADSAIADIRKTLLRKHNLPIPCEAGQRVIFKVIGKTDFIFGADYYLIDFLHVRKSALSSRQVDLSLQVVDEKETDEKRALKYTFRDVLNGNPVGNARKQNPNPFRNAGPTEHADLSIDSNKAHLLRELSLWDMNVSMELVVNSLSCITLPADIIKEKNLKENDDVYVCVLGQLYHGTHQLAPPCVTPWKSLKDAVPNPSLEASVHTVWGSTHGLLRFPMLLAHIPRDARLCLTVVACADVRTVRDCMDDDDLTLLEEAQGKPDGRRGMHRVNRNIRSMYSKQEETQNSSIFYLGWVNYQLFDHLDYLCMGNQTLRMWVGNEKANPIGVVSTPKIDAKTERGKHLTINISLPTFARKVKFPRGDVPAHMKRELAEGHKQAMNELDASLRKNVVNQLRRVRIVIQRDPLYRLNPVDKQLLWQFRKDLTNNPAALSKFLQAVDWASPAAVQDCLKLLYNPDESQRWSQPPKGEELVALELLDARYAHSQVRAYAILILDKLCDALLAECILQLVQVLKYEPYHYSALARFLLKRSVSNPHQIGHAVFWHLKAEMSNPAVQERHGLLIEELLKRVPVTVRRLFEKEDALIECLLKIGVEVKKEKEKKERNTYIRTKLDEKLQKLLKSNTTFTLPLDRRMEASGLIIERCKVMDSKKLPLFLVFKNADPMGEPIYVIFKAGDDLRQDLLTLQIISMMDSMWKAQGLDLHMSPYGCVACDDGVGMIEVVLDSDTIANITKKSGGAMMAFREDPMINWLRQQPCNKEREGVKKCMWNFLYSCSGYCVATYILGIGDRHNDNIMMQQNGTLFHIDFGHFLGNFKSKFGVKRETSPFIFTPMYAYVLGGEKSPVYKHFVNVACTAYNIVRRSSHIIISLFALMLSTGIPELRKPEDIEWLQKVLLRGEEAANDEEAARAYAELVKESLANKRTLLNDYIHIMVH